MDCLHTDNEFNQELKARNKFELFYEFVMWDYSKSKIELDAIKDELDRRYVRRPTIIFSISALLINFSLLFIEAVYNSRWEFFENSSIEIRKHLIVGFIINIILLVGLGFVVYETKDKIWKLIFGLVIFIFLTPSILKTAFDIKNYLK